MCNLWRLTCSHCKQPLQGPLTHCPQHKHNHDTNTHNTCPGTTHTFHIRAEVFCQDCFAAPFKSEARASLSSMMMNLSTYTASEPAAAKKTRGDAPSLHKVKAAFTRPSLHLVKDFILLSSSWRARFITRLRHTFKPSLKKSRPRRRITPTPSRHPLPTSKVKPHPLPYPAPDPSHHPKCQDPDIVASAELAYKEGSVDKTSSFGSCTPRVAPSPSLFIRDTMNLMLTVCFAMIPLSWTIYQPWRK